MVGNTLLCLLSNLNASNDSSCQNSFGRQFRATDIKMKENVCLSLAVFFLRKFPKYKKIDLCLRDVSRNGARLCLELGLLTVIPVSHTYSLSAESWSSMKKKHTYLGSIYSVQGAELTALPHWPAWT